MNWSPIIRIALRYASGVLVARGAIDMTTANLIATDPDLLQAVSQGAELIAGVVVGVVTEWWYSRAKRKGGAT